MVQYGDNAIILQSGSINNVFYIISEGNVEVDICDKSVVLEKGDIVGIFDITVPNHIFTYKSKGNTALIPYSFQSLKEFTALLDSQPHLKKSLLVSVTRNMSSIINLYRTLNGQGQMLKLFINNSIKKYRETSLTIEVNPKVMPFMEEFTQSLESTEDFPFWFKDFYIDIKKVIADTQSPFSTNFTYGLLCKCSEDISFVIKEYESCREIIENHRACLVREDSNDLLSLFKDCYIKAASKGLEAEPIKKIIEGIIAKYNSSSTGVNTNENADYISRSLLELSSPATLPETIAEIDRDRIIAELKLSAEIILDFARCEEDFRSGFLQSLDFYKKCSDKYSSDKEVDSCRRKLAKDFYTVYEKALIKVLEGEPASNVIIMFLNFGFMDLELCGEENSIELYLLSERFKGGLQKKDYKIYTALEWFQAIYNGEKNPSRNEFDVDYAQNIRTLHKEGRITKEEAARLQDDSLSKVSYEIHNMFSTVNRITTGRLFGYCPVLTEDNLLRSPGSMLLEVGAIDKVINHLNSIDYSIFYHESVFQDLEANIKEIVRHDILPDIILMPNVGSKEIMWQEIEGMNRKTPARMMIPCLFQEAIDKAFVRMFAEYRWEMCKREMGGRWNDVTAHSLTGDYCDYAQFFQKDHDLSLDTKEKIKAQLKKCKNSFKELFISDYSQFILSESSGSTRLNKTARAMLFRYCPFSSEYREAVSGNTMFEELINHHKLKVNQEIHRMQQIENRYKQMGKELPDILKLQAEMVQR